MNKTLPSKYTAAYNQNIVELELDNIYENHKVLMTLIDETDNIPMTNIQLSTDTMSMGNNIYTKFNFTNQPFKTGDVIYIKGDLYTVIDFADDYFVINDLISLYIPQQISDYISKVLRQFKAPVINGKVRFDMKEYLAHTLKSEYDIDKSEPYYPTLNSKNVSIIFQESFDYNWEFDDNTFDAGNVGFTTTNSSQLKLFNIGDMIVIEQQLTQWNFNQTFDDNGKFLLSNGGVNSNFTVGEGITIATSNKDSALNGKFRILAVGNDNVTIDLPYDPADPSGSGQTYSLAKPSYNGSTVITDIKNNGNTIITDKGWAGSSIPVGGKIYLYEKTFIKNLDIFQNDNTYKFNIYQAQLDINLLSKPITDSEFPDTDIINNMYEYIMNDNTAIETKFATDYKQVKAGKSFNKATASFKNTLDDSYIYPLNINSKSSISALNLKQTLTDIYVICFDKTRNWLGEFYLPFNQVTGSFTNAYVPIGFDSLYNGTANRNDNSNNKSFTEDDVKYYTVFLTNGSQSKYKTRPLTFVITDECKNENIDLLFRDTKGSLIPIPFNKASREFIEVDKKFYNTDKQSATYSGREFNEKSGDIQYNSRSKYKYILNTDFVPEHTSEMIVSAFKSPEVYLHNHTTNELFRISITGKSVENKKMNNDKLIQYKIEAERAITNKHY